MEKVIGLKQMYDLIDLYKYASIDGERVEFIVYPTKDNKRIITIGLQNGFSRDRDTFIFEDGEKFDKEIYPELLSYFKHDDALGNWDITVPEIEGATVKGVCETQEGNVVYLDTYNKDLYDSLDKEVEVVEEKTTYKNDELTNEDKIWDEIILYAKERRQLLDFYRGSGFSKEELDKIYEFVVKLIETAKNINYGKTRKAKKNNEEYLNKLFENKEELRSMGLPDEISSKIVNTSMVKKLAHIAGVEKRIRNRLDLNNEEIEDKIEFAVSELDKVEFFDLVNANYKKFADKSFDTSKPRAIEDLISLYENEDLYDEETRNRYTDYGKEILKYLERKANSGKKVKEEKENEEIVEFKEYDSSVVDDYDAFNDAVELIEGAKLDNERYEIVATEEEDCIRVRINFIDGVTKSDIYEFVFTDKEKIRKIIYDLDNKFFENGHKVSISGITTSLEDKEMYVSLFKSDEGNEVLTKEISKGEPEYEPVNEDKPVEDEPKEEPVKEDKTVEDEPTDRNVKLVSTEDLEAIDKQVSEFLDAQEKGLDPLAAIDKQVSDYLLEQENKTKEPENKELKMPGEDISIYDIDLASYGLLLEKYGDKLVDLINSNKIPQEEAEIIIRMEAKRDVLAMYYNDNYEKLDTMSKEEIALFAKCEAFLLTIFGIEAKYKNNKEQIKRMKKISSLTPAGRFLLNYLEKEDRGLIDTDYVDDIFEFNIARYAEITEKYLGEAKDIPSEEIKKDREEFLKIVKYKMRLIDAYNALLFKKDDLTPKEAAKLAKYETRLYKIFEIDVKYDKDRTIAIEELRNNKAFLLPSSQILLSVLEKSLENGLFEVVEKEPEKKEDSELEEIRDAYEVALSYASSDTPAIIEVKFNKDNKDEADVIISNKDIVIYQRTISIDRLNSGIMDELNKMYTKNNEVQYNIKFNISGTVDNCLLLIGENRRTFKITNATEAFVDENKKKIEDLLNKEEEKVK